MKGSEAALKSPGYVMDRQTYEGLSERMYPTFASDRQRLYELFEQYSRRKLELGDRDPADRFLLCTVVSEIY